MAHPNASDPFAAPLDGARKAPRVRSAHHALLFDLAKNRRAIWSIIGVIAVTIAAVCLIVLYTDIQWSTVTDWIAELNPLAVIPAMALLPIAGFPIAIVYLIAGARFGPLVGGVIVTFATAIHLLGTYAIARSFLRAPLQRFIEKRHARLPEIPVDEQALVCVIAALVPGLPYVVRNYLMALAGVRLKYFFWVCLPIYVARSYVTILMGDMSSNPTQNRILILVAVDAVKVAICGYVIWRLRQHHRKFHPEPHEVEPGATPPPSAAVS